MMRGDPVPLFEALLLLLLPAGSKQRTPLLEQILVFLRSDACLLAQLAQQCVTLQHVLRCSAATATLEAKRTHAGRVVAHQLKVPPPLQRPRPPTYCTRRAGPAVGPGARAEHTKRALNP